MDEDDECLFRHYHSHGLHIERTECCDDCGPDTRSLMLGDERSLENRTEIRRKLVQFVDEHRGNRALISILSHCQELNHNLGCHDLESAAEELFTNRCRGAALAMEEIEAVTGCYYDYAGTTAAEMCKTYGHDCKSGKTPSHNGRDNDCS